MDHIYIGSDFNVKYYGAQDAISAAALNSGTCTYAIKDADDVTVSGGTGTLDYVAASSGDYLGVIDAAVTALLTVNAQYTVVITFSKSGYDDVRYLEVTAKRRGQS